MAERPGFEPGGQFYPTNRLAGGCLRPLGHLSALLPPRCCLDFRTTRMGSRPLCLGSLCALPRLCPVTLAEGVGFEPTDLSVIPFQAGRLRPLGHPSHELCALAGLFAAVVSRRSAFVAGVSLLVLLEAIEVVAVHPYELSFFNRLIGGPKNGYKYLADSNLDWGQDLKGLKQWMDRNGVRHINLDYFGTADPSYYGIEYTALPGSLRMGISPMRSMKSIIELESTA